MPELNDRSIAAVDSGAKPASDENSPELASSRHRVPDIFWWLACAGVFVLQAVLVFQHEPFVDEWQALQIAVQSPDMAVLLQNLRYEGHPPLWHLVLRGLAALAGPYLALPLAALLLGFTTQYLILFKSPFSRQLRLLIALSEFVLFEYNTVSRSYTLGVALVFLCMALWDRRKLLWLAIALLPLVDFLFGVMSLAFVWLRWRERRLWWPGIAVWVVASLFAAWTVLPAPDVVPVYRASPHEVYAVVIWMARLSVVMLPFQGEFLAPQWDGRLPLLPSLTLWLPFVAMCWLQTRKRIAHRVVIFGFLFLLLAFFVLFYALMNRHVMLAAVLLIALAWRDWRNGQPPHPLFRAWLWIAAAMGLVTSGIALLRPFDTAPQVARKIGELGLGDAHWAVYPVQHGQGISAMTGLRFERLGAECMMDVIRWNERLEFASQAELARFVVDRSAVEGTFHLLVSTPLPAGPHIAELARIGSGYDGKQYYLYRIGDGTRPFSRRLSLCLPEMGPLSDRPLIPVR